MTNPHKSKSLQSPVNSTANEYYCGPQSWPAWIRKPLSKYYNRACRNHDKNYADLTEFKEAEKQFKSEVKRRRRVLRKALKFEKVSLTTYLIHGTIFGRLMPRLTRRFGKHFYPEKK